MLWIMPPPPIKINEIKIKRTNQSPRPLEYKSAAAGWTRCKVSSVTSANEPIRNNAAKNNASPTVPSSFEPVRRSPRFFPQILNRRAKVTAPVYAAVNLSVLVVPVDPQWFGATGIPGSWTSKGDGPKQLVIWPAGVE